MEHPIRLVFGSAEALRERLLHEIENIDDVETLILYAQVIFRKKAEEDELGRIVFRYDPDDPWLRAVYQFPSPDTAEDDVGTEEQED